MPTVQELLEVRYKEHAEKEKIQNEKIDAQIMKHADNPVLGFL
jgi:hypothetical protein